MKKRVYRNSLALVKQVSEALNFCGNSLILVKQVSEALNFCGVLSIICSHHVSL